MFIFEKEQFSLQFFSSLLQVYIVYRVSFIFHLNPFLKPVCTRRFAHLFCWPRGRGIGLVCTRRFSFHEFYNFLLFNFLIFIFLDDIFLPTTFTHTHDPRPTIHTHDPHPRPTTSTHYPRPTTFSYTRKFGALQGTKVLRAGANYRNRKYWRYESDEITLACNYMTWFDCGLK